jgi:hypothetical protein
VNRRPNRCFFTLLSCKFQPAAQGALRAHERQRPREPAGRGENRNRSSSRPVEKQQFARPLGPVHQQPLLGVHRHSPSVAVLGAPGPAYVRRIRRVQARSKHGCCRVEPYWIKATALRAAAPAAHAPGVRPWGPTRRGTAGSGLNAWRLPMTTAYCLTGQERASATRSRSFEQRRLGSG